MELHIDASLDQTDLNRTASFCMQGGPTGSFVGLEIASQPQLKQDIKVSVLF